MSFCWSFRIWVSNISERKCLVCICFLELGYEIKAKLGKDSSLFTRVKCQCSLNAELTSVKIKVICLIMPYMHNIHENIHGI